MNLCAALTSNREERKPIDADRPDRSKPAKAAEHLSEIGIDY